MVGGPYKALLELNRSHRLGPGILDRWIPRGIDWVTLQATGSLDRLPTLSLDLEVRRIGICVLSHAQPTLNLGRIHSYSVPRSDPCFFTCLKYLLWRSPTTWGALEPLLYLGAPIKSPFSCFRQLHLPDRERLVYRTEPHIIRSLEALLDRITFGATTDCILVRGTGISIGSSDLRCPACFMGLVLLPYPSLPYARKSQLVTLPPQYQMISRGQSPLIPWLVQTNNHLLEIQSL